MPDYIIKVENLGKKYRIHHQQDGQRYVAMRDVLAEKLTAPFRWLAAQSAKRGVQSAKREEQRAKSEEVRAKREEQSVEDKVQRAEGKEQSVSNSESFPHALSSLPFAPGPVPLPLGSVPFALTPSPLPLSPLPLAPSALPLPLTPLPREEDFWALRGVNFEVKQGEVVGIIGRNGAGKSTLLKILSRITEPTEGRVRLRGRVASLLEVGTGFHPELTGRENIYLNGAVLGMTRAEIRKKFDEIVAFAEIEKFLDTPVKRYSSGMYVRLAFAIAAHLEPEILIVDEVLAVGDAEFQKKCLGKMGEVAKQGRTVLFISHNMGVVRELTQRCVLLHQGLVAATGNSQEMVEMYLIRSNEITTGERRNIEFYRRDRKENSPAKIIGINVNAPHHDVAILPRIEVGAKFTIEVQLQVSKAIHGAFIDMELKTSLGDRVTYLLSLDQNYSLFLHAGHYRIAAQIDNLPVSPGEYSLSVGVNQSIQTRAYDVILDFPLFRVINNGQVFHWPERPWGMLHCNTVKWSCSSI